MLKSGESGGQKVYIEGLHLKERDKEKIQVNFGKNPSNVLRTNLKESNIKIEVPKGKGT